MKDSFMKEAITLSEKYMLLGEGGPFGCVIVKNNEIVGRGWNSVLKDQNPTCHAEMNAIKNACKNLETHILEDCELYTSCEPCPMCLAAIYWARIKVVYFANTRKDAQSIDFDDDFIYNEINLNPEERTIEMINMDKQDAWKVFEKWRNMDKKIPY